MNIAPVHPTAGCVTAIVPHPTNENILYIGTANGGVWRTDNALATNPRWRPLTDDQLSGSIGALQIDLGDGSGNTLYAGFGRRSSFGLGGAQKGLIKTTDGGATWTPIGGTQLDGRMIYKIAVRGAFMLVAVPCNVNGADCTDNGTLPGLYRTTDGGATFTNMSGLAGSGLPAGAVTFLASDPTNTTRYYVHVTGVGVFRTTDSGATWTNISAGMAAANVAQLALTVSNSGVLYAAERSSISRVYRSTNQGNSWVQMDSVQANLSTFFNGIVADPVNPNVIYLSGLFVRTSFPYSGRVVRGDASLTAGSQWVSIASTSGLGIGTAPHTDSRALVFTAGNRLIEGDDGGIYELPVADTGTGGSPSGGMGSAWRSLIGNLQNTEMHSVAYDPLARIIIGGAQDTGFQEQVSAGLPLWDKTSNGDGGDALVDNLSSPGSSLRYGSSQNLGGSYRAVYDPDNNQLSWVTLNLTGLSGSRGFVTPLAINSVSGNRLLAGTSAGVFESLNKGDNFVRVDTSVINNLAKTAYGGRLNGVADPSIVFFGSASTVRYRTTAGGPFSSAVFPGGTVQAIVLDPENWQTAYIIGPTSVYSATGTLSGFTDVTGNLTGVGTFHTIEYLTLPDGNALMVGTDVGAFIMRLSAPGVWKTLGDNLPHTLVMDSQFDKAGQVLAISTLGRGAFLYDFKSTKARSQYGETFQAFADGTSTLPATAGELFSSQLGIFTKVADNSMRELQLTADGGGATRSAFRLPDLDPGKAVTAFSAKWNASIYGDSSALADGFSFNFGPLGAVTAAAFTNGTYLNEDGFNAGLSVSVRTYSSNLPGYYVRVNGATVPGGFVPKAATSWGNFNTTRHFFEVDWRSDTGLTLRVDGVAIFTNLATPGFAPAAGYRFVFGARTGGFDEEVRLDNLAIFTGGVLAPIAPAAPYYYSDQDAAGGQGADKAFDGNPATKWFTPDYTGHIGAGILSPKAVRLYTLTSGNDSPTRDLAAWDFQTGDNGTRWTQHGAQAAQFFQNRLEQRAFVVANPTPNTKFRLLISSNHDAPEIQLAEFKPWELVAAPAQFQVTNTGDAGAGSFRKALADSVAYAGTSMITFAPGLSGQTITLTSEIVLPAMTDAKIDATGLASGITLDGGAGTNRILTVNSGGSLTVSGVTFTGGNGGGAQNDGDGGALVNYGTLVLGRCTFTGNSATMAGSMTGGAILNTGTLTMRSCTVSGNAGGFGGGLSNYGQSTLTHCTFSGNTASFNGGGIDNGNGTGIILTLENTIVAGNTAGFGSDINNYNGTVTLVGANLVQGYGGIAATGSGSISTADPFLAPLDHYGGLTKTRALRPGSAALNAAAGSSATSDQRGFPIVGIPDIGAYEAGTYTNYNAWIWELLPVSATVAQHDMTADYDGDGETNNEEWLALTHPGDALSLFKITNLTRSGNSLSVTFTTSLGRNYTLETTTNFVSWTPLATVYPGTGNPRTEVISSGLPKLNVRARVGP